MGRIDDKSLGKDGGSWVAWIDGLAGLVHQNAPLRWMALGVTQISCLEELWLQGHAIRHYLTFIYFTCYN